VAGVPFADAGCERLQREQAPPLSELRLQAAERRAEAGLALGRHAELVGELAGWCAAEPLRERFAVLRMRALYRSGRQADALAAFQQVRRMLVDGLGVEPGEELRRSLPGTTSRAFTWRTASSCTVGSATGPGRPTST
jgi:DNA-binding SARP family transcriptional activator